MDRTADVRMHSSRPGFLAEVTLILLLIRDTRASGRLSMRNSERFGIAHLYFKEARLIHVTGDKRDAEATLTDLLSCSKGSARFDSGTLVTFESLTWQQANIFGRWLAFLEMRGIMQGIAQERLEGLGRSLMLRLPGEPIALPREAVEAVKQSVGQKVEQAIAQAASPLPPELQARSIRNRSAFRQLSEDRSGTS